MTKGYDKEIDALTQEIKIRGDIWSLYYERGYFFFLNNNETEAKNDYRHAVSIGLDPTEMPYYSYSASNSLRRNFLLPEKIMVFLLVIVIIFSLITQIASFILKIKGNV